jgi:hypothetical protein
MSKPNYVLVVDTNRKPLNPCTPGVARSLLKAKKAKVFRRYPFTIILNQAVENKPKPMQLKLDPGSKTTGIALLQEEKVVWAGELTHRGQQIKDSLESRRALRRGRRHRKTRYRKARFLNRSRLKGWLAPSLQHRVETGLPVETGSGGKTKYNRIRLELSKHHYIDAACVGNVDNLQILTTQPLLIKATGHGTRQMCRTDKFGFPSRHVPRNKFVRGFQTGDIVKAAVTQGKKIGLYVGRVAVRSTGSFNISDKTGLVQGISHQYCQVVHRKDGYNYAC